MSKGSTQVDAPNPFEVARADATFNRIDQFTPFGNLQFSGPNRNRADLTLNPAIADLENRRLLSDRMLLDTALSRQGDIKGGSLPSLTSNINPSGLQEFFGLPQNLQTGTEGPANVPNVPDSVGNFTGQDISGHPFSVGGPQDTSFFAPGNNPQATSMMGRIPGSPQDFAKPGAGVLAGQPDQVAPTQGFTAGGTQTAEEAGAAYDAEQARRAQAGIPPLQYPRPTGPVTTPGEGQFMQGGQPQQGGPFGGSIGGLVDPSRMGQLGSLSQLDQAGIGGGRVEKALFDRQLALLQPQLDQQQQRLQQDLANRGIPRDSEAGQRELAGFRSGRDLQLGNIANQAVLGGGQEQSRQFGLLNQLGGNRDAATQQLFGMADLLGQRDVQAQLQNANISQANRATQFNELASLLGLQQVASPGLNNFFAPANADVTGGFALNQQAQAGNANRAAGMKGGLLGGATDLGGAAIGAK